MVIGWDPMGLKEFYHAIEDKYYAGLDWLDAHGVPVYRVVDAIEAQNIPSFPVAMLLLVLVLGGLWFALSGNLGGGNALTITVIDGTQTPISGARVELSGDNFVAQSLLTDARGKVTFSGLPQGVLLTLSASKEDYQFRNTTVTLDSGENVARITGIAIPKNKSIALQLYQSGTTQAFADAVELQFSCPEDSTFNETRVVTNGRVTLQDVPADCDTLTVTSSDVRVQLQTGVVDTTAAQPSLYLSFAAQGNAELQVTIVGADALPIEGIEVVLNSAYGDPLQTKFSDNAGSVKFTGIVPDTYTVSAYDGQGRYASKTSPATSISGTNNSLTLVMEQAAVGEVRLQIVDESNLAPIANATVIVSRGTQTLPSKRTDETGKVSIPVSSGAGLSASIDHPNYLISVVPVTVSTAGFSTIALTRATAENSQVLTVQIKDELNNPVEGAQVALKKAVTGASVGATKTTGASGTVVFTSLEEGGYFVSAYKPGFSDQKRSDVVQVRARTNASVALQLTLGTGTIEVSVKDDAGVAISGATIQVRDAITHNAAANEAISDVEGKASITLRADKIVYFVISEGTFSTVTTIPYAVKKGVNQKIEVELPKSISRLETRILQLLFKGQPLESESALVPGQTYTAIMGLYLPDGSEPTEAAIHVRTGNSDEGRTNPIENDDWYIRDVRAAHSIIKRGTTYTPPLGLGIDNQNLTTGNAKWANVVIQNPNAGLTLVEVDLQVKDSAVQGVDLPLYYRAYAKSGSYTRFPLDAVLGGSDSTGEKQGLYANANLATYSVGNTSSTCTKDMCVALVLEDLQTRLQNPVFNETEVDVSTQHRLGFVFRSLSDSVLQDTKILVKSSTASADLKTYEVVNAVGVKKTGTAQGNIVDVALGTVQRDNVITGFVNFAASKEGSSNITLSIISGKNEIFKRELRVKVNAASVFETEVLPQAILPLLTNQLLVKAYVAAEGGRIGLENVAVTIKKNGTTLTSGFTDGEGIFPYELNEPNVGDVIEFTLEKPGYKPIIKTIRVGDNIVLFSPNQINENLIINGVSRKTREVRLTNLASIPLKLTEVRLSGGFDDLVKFELLSDNLIGTEIPVNGDVNLAFALELTEKGMRLLNAQTFNGAIVVTTETTTSAKTFVNALPAVIKAGFGGEVDDSSCLIVEPLKWDIYTNTNEQKQLGFEIKNNCKVKGEPVRLANLSAKIKQISGDTLGTFTATALEGRSVELGAGYRVIVDSLPANGSTTVNVKFAPGNILSGVATPELAFQAINLTQGGSEDSVMDTVKVNLVVNDLTKCLEVKTPQSLTIESCPINLGFGQYGNYFNQGLYQPTGVPYYNPSFSVLNQTTNPSGTSLLPSNQSTPNYNQGSSIYNPYYTRNTLNSGYYGTTGYNGLGQYNPNGQPFNPNNGNYAQLNGYYANPYVDSYNNFPGGYSNYISGCGSTEVRIENSCQTEVDVQLDADPNLQTSANTFTLKPNSTQRVRIASGVRIGRYPFVVNAKSRGSVDATTEVASLAVLIKSPTEVNGDCISLDRTKYSFNEFVQTPVKGKVYNNCYDQGVRLVERGDTVTLSSFFNPDATQEVVLDPRTVPGAIPRNNTLVNSIQTTGLTTKSNGDGGTIQVYEFQIFPDFQTYRRQLAPGQQGGIGEKILDIKSFAEKNYYRVESYGVISVKYLDAFSAAQQKQFPVIFENLFKLASALDALIGGGSPAITNFQDCINPNALQNRAVTSDNKEVAPLVFGDNDFKQFTTFTYLTQFPDSVIRVSDAHCGGQDYLSKLNPARIESRDDSRVFATFQVVDKRDIQVTINRPLTLNRDVVIEGRIEAELTRTFVNAGTQRVSIPVKITVQRLKNPQNNNALQLQACTAEGYVSGSNFVSRYGFDKLSWEWEYEKAPDCTTTFCDGTQLMLYLAKTKLGNFNKFLENNSKTGAVFSDSERTGENAYSTRTLVTDIHDSVAGIEDDTTYDLDAEEAEDKFTFFVAKRPAAGDTTSLLHVPQNSAIRQSLTDYETEVNRLNKDSSLQDRMNMATLMQDKLENFTDIPTVNQLVIVIDPKKLCANDPKNDKKALEDCPAQKVVELLGAETRNVGKVSNKMFWLYGEYKEFHTQAMDRLKNIQLANKLDDPSVGFEIKPSNPDKWALRKSGSVDEVPYGGYADAIIGSDALSIDSDMNVFPEDAYVFVSKELAVAITSAIESNFIAYAVPGNGEDISLEAENYILSNAKTKDGFTWAPYASSDDFRAQFRETKAYLLADTYSSALLEGLNSDSVQIDKYNYVQNIDRQAGAGTYNAMRNTLFASTATSIQEIQTTAQLAEETAKIKALVDNLEKVIDDIAGEPSAPTTEAESIPIVTNSSNRVELSAAGQYKVRLEAVWNASAKTFGTLGVFIPQYETEVLSLEEIDASNATAGKGTSYVDNPFMYVAFDGLTGGTQRTDFGLGGGVLANLDESVVLKGNVGLVAGGANQPTITTYYDQQPTAAANKIAQFTNKAGRPALFKLQKLGDAWAFDYAPNRIAPVKTTLFSTEVPIYQYIVADAILANTTGAYTFDPGIITWVDCSNASVDFFTANKGAQNALMCNPSRANDFVLNGARAGTDYSYLGVALLPPGDTPLYMYPICARDSAAIQNAVQSTPVQLSATSTTQLGQVELKATVAAPKDLWEMIQYINNGTACASIGQDNLDIIWNLGSTSVVPNKLLCQATGASNTPVAPQAPAATGN